MGRFAFEAFPQAFKVSGGGEPGAQLYVYAAGSTTPVTTYSDPTFLFPQSNPIIAKSSGIFPQIYMQESGLFKVRILTADGVLIDEADWVNQNAASVTENISQLELITTPFEERSDFVTWWDENAAAIPDGTVLAAAGFQYVKDGGSTISDLAGLSPVGDATPYHYGAVGGGADDTTALQAWLSSDLPLLLTDAHRATGPLTCRNLALSGLGWSVSKITWDSGEGLTVTATNSQQTLIRDLSLLTLGVASGTALKIDYSALVSGGTYFPRASAAVRLSNLIISGATSGVTTNGWDIGLDCISFLGFEMQGCRINGVYTGAYGSVPDSSFGMRLRGAGLPAHASIDRCEFSAWAIGLHSAEWEGVRLTDTTLVTVGTGVKVENVGREPEFKMRGGHINGIEYGLHLTKATQFSITDCLLYSLSTVANDYTHIYIGEDCDGRIDGVVFLAENKTGTNYRGIVKDGTSAISEFTKVTNCDFRFGNGADHFAIENTSNAGYMWVDSNNTYRSMSRAVRIVGQGVGPVLCRERLAFVGDLNTISIDDDMLEQTYYLASGCTNGPAAINTAGSRLQINTFDANTASRTFYRVSSNEEYKSHLISGVWGAWTQTI